MICIVLLNEVPASHSTLAAQLTPAWLESAAADLQAQLRDDVAPYWPAAEGAVVRVGAGKHDVGAAEIPFRIVPTLPDAPDAIAYHDFAGGFPDAFLGLDTCSTVDDVAEALSHENVEIVGDPTCDAWRPFAGGGEIALELCDPVQSRSYRGASVSLSDFVLPSFFDASLAAPRTFLAAQGKANDVDADAIAPGGYEIRRDAAGNESQVFGLVPAHRLARARHPSSRWHRRGVRVSGQPLGSGAVVV